MEDKFRILYFLEATLALRLSFAGVMVNLQLVMRLMIKAFSSLLYVLP
jgi:hypothetical protein